MAAGRFVVPPYFPARDRDNNLLAGALLYVYENETTTKTNIYTDVALTVLSSNPVVANSSGQFPAIYAEAGTEASPVLYSVSVTTSTGASPGNPFNFDNYRPSVDWETAAAALAEAAAAAAEASAVGAAASAVSAAEDAVETAADLAAIEAIIADAPDAPSVLNKLNRNGDNASAGLMAAVGAQSPTLTALTDPIVDSDVLSVYRASLKRTTAGSLLAYVSDSLNIVGAAAQPQAQAMWRKIRAENEDVYLFFAGDSTGNETTEHFYLTAVAIGQDALTHTVIYRLWNDGAQAWGSNVTIQTGTGSKTIYVDNCSVTGTNTEYIEAGRAALIFASARDYDLVILSYGHNTGTDTAAPDILPDFRVSAGLMLQRFPQAGVFVTLQNSRKNWSGSDPGGPAQSLRMISAWRQAAQDMGLGTVDAYDAFASSPSYDVAPGGPGSLYLDTVHPSPAGSALWTAVEQAAIAETKALLATGGQSVSPLNVIRPNYAPNPVFADWTGATPDGYTFTNCTAEKNPGRGDGTLYSLRVTAGAGVNPTITADLAGQLPRLAGQTVSAVVCIRKPSGMGLLTGRIGLSASDGVTSESVTSYPRADSVNGYFYAMTTLTVPSTATSFVMTIYTGAADGSDVGEKIDILSIWIGEGVLPSAIDPIQDEAKTLSQFYSDDNAGLFTGNIGTLTAVGGTLTLTGSATTNSNIYVNMNSLTIGARYRITYTTSASTGNTDGPVYIRNGLNGGGTTVEETVWSVGVPNSITFTATASSMSWRQSGYTGLTGMVLTGFSIVPTASGITPTMPVSVQAGFNDNGTVLDATGAAGNFKIVSTPGTSVLLQGVDAQNNTKTDAVCFIVSLPEEYIAGRNINLAFYSLTTGTGTAGTRTIDAQAYLLAADGTGTVDLVATAVQNITGTGATYDFTVTGTSLSPRNLLMVRAVTVVQETANVNPLAGRINSLTIS